jgi:hypothetical protein
LLPSSDVSIQGSSPLVLGVGCIRRPLPASLPSHKSSSNLRALCPIQMLRTTLECTRLREMAGACSEQRCARPPSTRGDLVIESTRQTFCTFPCSAHVHWSMRSCNTALGTNVRYQTCTKPHQRVRSCLRLRRWCAAYCAMS